MKKILIAEDDKFLSKILATKIAKEGYEVAVAMDGEEALEKIKSEKPDAIFLDLIMPKKTGFEVLEQMKNDGSINKIPVIVLSNLGQVDDIQKSLSLGAKDHVIKANTPIDEIVSKIEKYL
jgi:CheY-like chemotaxis protein